MGKIIAIASQKGGVGKTTTVLNLGFSLSCLGQKILLVDGDPQGGMTVASNLKKRTEFGLLNLLRNDSSVENVVIPTKYETLAIVGTGISNPKDALFFEKEARAGNLGRIIRSIAGGYDYTLIDSPAGIGSLAAVLLTMSNSVLIPVSCQILAIKTLPSILNLTEKVREKINPDLRVEGVLITMMDNQNPSELEICEEVRNNFPGEVFFETTIPHDVNFEKSNAGAVPVAMLPEAKDAARSYMDLAIELKTRELHDKMRTAGDEHAEGLF